MLLSIFLTIAHLAAARKRVSYRICLIPFNFKVPIYDNVMREKRVPGQNSTLRFWRHWRGKASSSTRLSVDSYPLRWPGREKGERRNEKIVKENEEKGM